MAQEFGGRPEDRIRDDEGDTLTRITVEFYPTQSDVTFKTNSRGTTFVPANGVWTFTDPDLAELWIAPVGGPYFTPYQVRSTTYLSSTYARQGIAEAMPSVSLYENRTEFLKKIHYVKGATVYACTQASPWTVYRSDDYGKTWTTKGALPAEPKGIIRVEGTGTLIATENTSPTTAGLNPRVWRSTDDGLNWTQVHTMGFPPINGEGMSATPSGHVLLCEYGNVANTVYKLWRSTNDGQTWTSVLQSPGTDPAGDPGHIHSVTWDPYASCFVAFMDRPIAATDGPRLYRSNDEGATWTLIGAATTAEAPNFVTPMHFPEHIVWGYDNQRGGRIARIGRADFYAGRFDKAEDVAHLNEKVFYYTFPLRSEATGGPVWIISGGTETVNAQDLPNSPGSYAQELYLVSNEGLTVTAALQHVSPASNVGTLVANKSLFPARSFDTFDHKGIGWVGLNSGRHRGYVYVPFSQGWAPPGRSTTDTTTGLKLRNTVGILAALAADPDAHTTILALDANNRAVLQNTSSSGKPEVRLYESALIAFVLNAATIASVVPGFLRVDAAARLENGTGGPTVHAGTGDPNGSVTGKVGSLYLRSDGGAATSLYVKETGAGTTTGWVAK